MVAEPQCSPFHYHEQLLEKMIDVQYKMGIYSEKMEKWESAINEKLSKLEDKNGAASTAGEKTHSDRERHTS